MVKLNGIQSIGSIVEYEGKRCVISDASGDRYISYEISEIDRSVGYSGIGESELKVLTAKSPLKKHLTKLNSLDKKIERQSAKLSKEMKKIEKKRGWDNDDIPYDHYDNEHGAIMDGIAYGLGLDNLYDERNELMEEMIKSARKVKLQVA